MSWFLSIGTGARNSPQQHIAPPFANSDLTECPRNHAADGRGILHPMRYSTRWLLAVVAYVSLASAAIGTRSGILVDLLWAVSLLSLCYAALLAIAARGRRQVMALGFVALAVAYIAGLYLLPNRVPAMQVFAAAGYSVWSDGDIYEADQRFASQGAMRKATHMIPLIRTANAIGTLVSGLIGCLIGAMA